MDSKKLILIVLASLGVVAMAFLGVVMGGRYVEWRQASRLQEKVEGVRTGTSTGLRTGAAFPEVTLVDLDGAETATSQVLDGRETLVFFVSIGCDACTEAVLAWSERMDEVPPDVQVIGIADDDLGYVRVYAEKVEFPFTLLADEVDRFGTEYDMDVYPTVAGVSGDGVIRFVRHGINAGFTPETAVNLLRQH